MNRERQWRMADGGWRMVQKPRLCVDPSAIRYPPPAISRQRGAVMIVVLLALLLLAALVFYVFNLGWAAQQRVVAQNAADATAYSGGGWVARSMNEVALNNIAMARLIALINVMDSAPMAVEHTLIDQRALKQQIEDQFRRGVPDFWMQRALTEILSAVQMEVAALEPVNAQLNQSGFDMRTLTYYDAPGGKGKFWTAMESVDAASQVTLNNLGEAAQMAAMEAGRHNLSESKDGVALLLPANNGLPWKRGNFDDFRSVLGARGSYSGLPPRTVETARDPDWFNYRGPYDAVFGWRWFDNQQQSWLRGVSQNPVPIGSGGGGRWETRQPDPQFYIVFGPQRWMLDSLDNLETGLLRYSRFARDMDNLGDDIHVTSTVFWMDQLARIKLNYLWPGGGMVNVTHPEWIDDFDEARSIAAATRDRIKATRFVVVELKSIYPASSSKFGSDGSWAYVREGRWASPRIFYSRSWMDPTYWGADKIADHIWRTNWSYQDTDDTELGLPLRTDPDGKVIPYTIYRVDEYMFAGIDVGQDVEVGNPHNFASRNDLPAPIDFDHQQVPMDNSSRAQFFTYLGVVRQDAGGRLWPGQFDADKTHPRVALAQVRLFNNHSWDMWTPMWHAQLEPVSDYDTWLATLERDASLLATVPDLPIEFDIGELQTYLTSLLPLVQADLMVH
ncbi:MAG: hypothetical protein IT445_16945 [Phycisphaeraceae bacterium]|nr:hypothetical protein [Phycisphaeraceae bacterium]